MRRFLSLVALAAAACGPDLEPSLVVNPVCGLSAVVTWTTRDPASSWVEVGQDGTPLFRVGDDEPVTEHRVVVVGMHAEQSYDLRAVSVGDDGIERASASLPFTAGAVDPAYLQPLALVTDPGATAPGWTLANAMVASYGPITVVLFDEAGQLVWYYVHPGDDGGADIVTSWLPETAEILVGPHVAPGERPFQMDLTGAISWQGPEQPGDPDDVNIQDGQMHHVLERLGNGDTVTVVAEQRDLDGDQVQGDRIVQIAPDGSEAWAWDVFDHLEYRPEDVFMGIWWTHMNSVEVDLDAGLIHANSWVQGKAWKIDRDSGEILWTLGEGGDFAPDPDAAEPWFQYAHSFEPIGGDRYLIYDNGSNERHWSRAVEYALDEASMQAEIVWEYPGDFADDRWYVMSCGDVDQLENGDRLLVADKRVLEVTVEGEIVWQLTWVDTEETVDLRSYQAERIPALVEQI